MKKAARKGASAGRGAERGAGKGGKPDKGALFPLWQQAASFAARKHAGQLRKDGRTPYYAHVVRVAFTASVLFGCDDPAVIAAALAHDLIEDTTTDYEDLEDRFGKDVADMVVSLTKNMSLPEPDRERDYEARLAKADWRVRLVKLADAYDNVADSDNDPKQGDNLPRRLGACVRAVRLAERDAASHPETRRAIQLVNALVERYEKKAGPTWDPKRARG
ncbi:MAG: HD domain-containing protein [Phycisphaerales bacterium]|nr:HD domain-containing protein [Phycisphaerales bacterium]